jgi:hypothetical protein
MNDWSNSQRLRVSGLRLGTAWQDHRYAARQLRPNPGFRLTAFLTLSLGIGASTGVFRVAYGVLIDPLPYKDVPTMALISAIFIFPLMALAGTDLPARSAAHVNPLSALRSDY